MVLAVFMLVMPTIFTMWNTMLSSDKFITLKILLHHELKEILIRWGFSDPARDSLVSMQSCAKRNLDIP